MHGHTLAALRVPCRPMHQDSTWQHIKAKELYVYLFKALSECSNVQENFLYKTPWL